MTVLFLICPFQDHIQNYDLRRVFFWLLKYLRRVGRVVAVWFSFGHFTKRIVFARKVSLRALLSSCPCIESNSMRLLKFISTATGCRNGCRIRNYWYYAITANFPFLTEWNFNMCTITFIHHSIISSVGSRKKKILDTKDVVKRSKNAKMPKGHFFILKIQPRHCWFIHIMHGFEFECDEISSKKKINFNWPDRMIEIRRLK